MSWLDTFKNDERSLYWLAKYIHNNNLFNVECFPTNIKEACEIIKSWESESINGIGARLEYHQFKLMESYFENIFPIESFNWLSDKDPKQLSWVLFYINLNPIQQTHFAPPNKYHRNFASNIKEAYPLIIKTFDAAMTADGYKQSYLLTLKCVYSQYVIGKNPLPWLDIKDKETCSWVWRYLVEKVDEASGQKGTFQFIKPIDNETIYWSVIALISNWKLLKGRYLERVERLVVPLTSITLINKCFSKKKVSNYNNTVNITPNNMPSLYLNIENRSEITNKTPFLESIYYDQNTHYKVDPFPNSAIKIYTEQFNNDIRFTIQDIESRQNLPYTLKNIKTQSIFINEIKTQSIFINEIIDKLPTTEELTTSLYNAHKQRIHRQKSNSPLGLTKANQKILTNYAKEQKTTEKKALNEIVKTMLN